MLRLVCLLAALAVAGCSAPTPSAPPVESGAFVTTLGDDTLAVERFTRTGGVTEATVALRAPQTTLATYRLALEGSGGLADYQATVRQPLTGEVVSRTSAAPVGDSLRVTSTGSDGASAERVLGAGDRPLPFIDLVHWPFESMVERAVAAGGPLEQPLFTGRAVVAFTSDVADGSVTVRHPFRGPMTVRADDQGRVLTLDASETTRKLTVRRVNAVDVEAIAARWAREDAAGRSVGDLSGRGEATADIGPVQITIDYGQPRARGREVWGALVPWGEVWRTGANRATHLTTSQALVLDPDGAALAVPAGEYTLFSIPQADGGLLIVNRQTGQGGTTYNIGQDLGRVPLVRSSLAESVEAFEIRIEASDAQSGQLALRWDRDAFSVPFRLAE